MRAGPPAAPAADPVWGSLDVAARKALLRHFARAPRSLAAPPPSPVEWVATGVASNVHNGIAGTCLAPAVADRAIADTLTRLAGLPAIWHLDPTDTPADLPLRLAAAGCRPERTAVVMGAPASAVAVYPPPAGIEIVEVSTARGIGDWRRVAAAVWTESTDVALDAEADLYAGLPLGPDAPWRHWLAVAATGQPVGMISGLYTVDVVLLEHAGVRPAARGAGIGAALVGTVTADAAARGVPYAVLGPTPESRPLYERLGFSRQTCVPDRQFYLP